MKKKNQKEKFLTAHSTRNTWFLIHHEEHIINEVLIIFKEWASPSMVKYGYILSTAADSVASRFVLKCKRSFRVFKIPYWSCTRNSFHVPWPWWLCRYSNPWQQKINANHCFSTLGSSKATTFWWKKYIRKTWFGGTAVNSALDIFMSYVMFNSVCSVQICIQIRQSQWNWNSLHDT